MARYLVTWLMGFEAESPEEAARLALEVQRETFSGATHFLVEQLATGHTVHVDVDEELV